MKKILNVEVKNGRVVLWSSTLQLTLTVDGLEATSYSPIVGIVPTLFLTWEELEGFRGMSRHEWAQLVQGKEHGTIWQD